ncbi:MAG: hypothetical protein R2911_43355 [Caldilineaceae bacterium]
MQAASGFSGNLLRIYYAEHVIVRDLSIDGRFHQHRHHDPMPHNVLVSRVDSKT